MSILLVRHGQTDWNTEFRIQGRSNTILNSTGINQAKMTADYIKNNYSVERIYSSPLKRAYLTAEIISQGLNIELQPIDEFIELDFGKWEGLTWDEVKEKYSKDYDIWKEDKRYNRIPEGESYQDILDRMKIGIRKINIREKKVLVVTHSVNILASLLYINNEPFYKRPKQYVLGNAEVVEITDDQIAEYF